MLLQSHIGIGLDDMFQYDMLARSLAAGDGYRWYAPADVARLAPYLDLDLEKLVLDPRGMLTTFRAPLYPGILALVYMVFGAGPARFFAARLLQAGMGALLAPMTYVAGVMLLGAPDRSRDRVERASRVAAMLIAAYPMLILFPVGLATENLFFPLLLAAFLALLQLSRLLQAGRITTSRHLEPKVAVLAGVLLGLSALTRSVVFPFAVVACAWVWLDLRRPRLAALALLAFGCTIAPWIMRNSLVSGRLTGIETSMGYNLYLGYHPESTGTFTFGPSLDLLSILDDRVRDQVGTQRALDFMRADPARLPYLTLRRLGHFFDLEWRAFTYFYGNGLVGTLASPVLILILSALAAPFMFVASSALFGAAALSRGPQSRLLLLLLVAYTAPHVFILSEERFHLALLPFLAVLTGAAWMQPRADLRAPALWRWLAAAGVALLMLNWLGQIQRAWPTLVRLIGPGGSRMYLPY